MRELDKYAVEELKIPGELLMTNAARRLADFAVSRVAAGVSTAIFCGTGNNGGDGVAAAVRLVRLGFPTRIFMVGNSAKMSHDTAEMVRRLNEIDCTAEPFADEQADSGITITIPLDEFVMLQKHCYYDAEYAIELVKR